MQVNKKKLIIISVIVIICLAAIIYFFPRKVAFDIPLTDRAEATSSMSANLYVRRTIKGGRHTSGTVRIDGKDYGVKELTDESSKILRLYNSDDEWIGKLVIYPGMNLIQINIYKESMEATRGDVEDEFVWYGETKDIPKNLISVFIDLEGDIPTDHYIET